MMTSLMKYMCADWLAVFDTDEIQNKLIMHFFKTLWKHRFFHNLQDNTGEKSVNIRSATYTRIPFRYGWISILIIPLHFFEILAVFTQEKVLELHCSK